MPKKSTKIQKTKGWVTKRKFCGKTYTFRGYTKKKAMAKKGADRLSYVYHTRIVYNKTKSHPYALYVVKRKTKKYSAKSGSYDRRIMLALGQSKRGGLSFGQLKQQTGISTKPLQKRLKMHMERGNVYSPRRGHYGRVS